MPDVTPEALGRQVARKALTLAKGPQDLRLPAGTLAIAVDDGVELDRLGTWRAALTAQGLPPGGTVSTETDEAAWEAIEAEADRAETVLLGVFSPIRIHKDRSLLSEKLLAPLRRIAAKKPTVVVSFSSPFLVSQFPEAVAWLLAYGAQPVQIEAAVAALREGEGFAGHLPVALPAKLGGATHGRQGPDDRTPSFA
jgi:hypothetical protein